MNGKSETPVAVIFDFDGTIADSFVAFIHTAEIVLNRRPFSPNEVEELRKHSMPDVMKMLEIKKWQLPLLVIKGRKEVDRHMNDIKPFKNIPETLAELNKEGYKLYIVSSHSEEGIHAFLEKYQLSQFFSDIRGNVGLLSKPKAIKKLRRQLKYTNAQCVFVGDEVRDIQAAAKAGVRCISVAWGFNDPIALIKHSPTFLANKPSDLIQFLRS